ncbi:hypothetical protein Tco_1466589 [Tanacetum coccineum]
MKEKEDQQDVYPSTELSSYVSSYDESSSSDESGCLEKSVHGSMKMAISQKGPSKDLLNWYEDVNDQDEEEIDEKDDEIDEQEDEIDKEAKDGKDDSHDELWSPKTIGTNTKNLISLKMKGESSNSTQSTKKLVKSSEPIRNCIIGLANNKTLEMIVNKEFGVNKEEIILHQQRTPQLLKQKKLLQTQEDQLNTIQALNADALKVDLVVIQNTFSEKEDSNSETAFNKPVKESSLHSKIKDVHAIKYKMSKAKERCMTYFCSLHSHLQFLSKEDLKGTLIKHGFKWAFMSLFGQDDDTFTSIMFLNVDQLQKQLDKDEFQEDGSMAAFWVTQESKIHTGKALDVDLVVTESSKTESNLQDESSRSGNDTNTDDIDIRPIYDEEPMVRYNSLLNVISLL